MSLGEINQLLSSQRPQRATFICWATIADVYVDRGWYYIACPACGRKLKHTLTTLLCNNCNDLQVVGVIRFRVEVLVKDEEDEAVFVLFDRDAAQLTGWRAADLLDAVEGPDANVMFPEVLLQTIGLTYRFKIKITEFDFTTPRRALSVSRVLHEDHDDAANP